MKEEGVTKKDKTKPDRLLGHESSLGPGGNGSLLQLGQEQDTEQSCVFTDDVVLLYALSGAIVSQWVEI